MVIPTHSCNVHVCVGVYLHFPLTHMNKAARIRAIIVLALGLIALSMSARAQNVVLKGHTFTHQSVQKDSVDTGYEYQDKGGNKYTVYLSGTGKAYCWMKSKKTGKLYKRYLPKITAILKEMKNGKSSH